MAWEGFRVPGGSKEVLVGGVASGLCERDGEVKERSKKTDHGGKTNRISIYSVFDFYFEGLFSNKI